MGRFFGPFDRLPLDVVVHPPVAFAEENARTVGDDLVFQVAKAVVGGDGTVYIGHNSLYAINPDSTLKWSTQLCGGAGFTDLDEPVIGIDGTIYMIAGQTGLCPLEAFW